MEGIIINFCAKAGKFYKTLCNCQCQSCKTQPFLRYFREIGDLLFSNSFTLSAEQGRNLFPYKMSSISIFMGAKLKKYFQGSSMLVKLLIGPLPSIHSFKQAERTSEPWEQVQHNIGKIRYINNGTNRTV